MICLVIDCTHSLRMDLCQDAESTHKEGLHAEIGNKDRGMGIGKGMHSRSEDEDHWMGEDFSQGPRQQ